LSSPPSPQCAETPGSAHASAQLDPNRLTSEPFSYVLRTRP
jgi:hypothetical protein